SLVDGRQAFADLLPRGAAIGRLEYPAAVHALVDLPAPRRDPAGPEHRIHRVRIRRVEHDLCGTDVRALVQHLLEGLAAIGGTEDAAFRIRAVGMAKHGYEEPVCI